MNLSQSSTLIKYKNYRYFKIAGLLVAVALVAYVSVKPADSLFYGGTWLSFVLGVTSALIIIVLMLYGVRKRVASKVPERRHYRTSVVHQQEERNAQDDFYALHKAERRKRDIREGWRYGGTLQGWLSAHVYLGASLIVLASLHTGFQFSWNIHTLTYVLMLLVIANGFYGLFTYLNYPALITRNMGEDTLNGLLLKIDKLDELARIRALDLPDEVNALVLKARRETRLGGNLLQQLSGSQHDCPTDAAILGIRLLSKTLIADDQPKLMRDLYSVLLQKQKLVLRVRNEIKIKASMQLWLYLHTPLSVALLAALFTHIVAIFFYW
ncbi:MAG: hypothetical protein A3F73_14345 [Gallionellales bacterium RIFCSPLOWO2_12_FULL_59_22]|nr:MAG: hypothetical protein A3H99_06970 [Gallionellales bacterium RIFCSPLOWO2_02_FULL_59_110]OGT05597.1 MAG: hypothetical protein A2Z65_04180 [Gallionellales bacterium RIFCSPLOWO2_02_58_13]OGT14734.1 MAG: hypothetical protein A3F73_14345 [Gallionellales bacterium RIFCSPLOWO2_12_FULL_59_22]